MFHIIDTEVYDTRYNSIISLVNAGTGSYICNNFIPAGLSPTRWAKKYQAFLSGGGLAFGGDGNALASAILNTLQSGEAQYVMIDELDNGSRGDSRAMIAQCCNALAAHTQWAGRWGCFLSMKHYASQLNGPAPNNAIDRLLQVNAIVAAEMYVTQQAYHTASGGGAGNGPAPNYPAGDTWMGNYFKGDASIARFTWLVNRRSFNQSSSRLTAVFSVWDQDLNRVNNKNAFMNHVLWIWRHKTGYPSTINATNGGAGTYKWAYNSIADPNRDAVYQNAWNYYCRDFNPGSGAAGPYT
jgi:hypothetical protein